MTKEEIKATYSVPDILRRYGVQVRNGRCRSVCHDGDRYTSKVSDDLYYCFKCCQPMDIFDLMMHFNGCGFKTAFEMLGGGEKPSWRASVIANRETKKRSDRIEKQEKLDYGIRAARLEIAAYKNLIKENEPFSDLWCWSQNRLVYKEYELEELTMELVNGHK